MGVTVKIESHDDGETATVLHSVETVLDVTARREISYAYPVPRVGIEITGTIRSADATGH